jgi:SNF2 family DNA or RNA helicase
MGLGKTAVVLTALRDEDLPALVLAPLRVAEEVWEVERDRWRPDLSIATAVGKPEARLGRLKAGADVTVMTRDTVTDLNRRGRKVVRDLPRFPYYKTVVLDELSGYKTKSTARWRETEKVVPPGGNVWGMTGTPAPNGLMDLWAQVYMLDGGARLGGTLTAYRDRYFDVLRRHKVTNVVIEWGLKPGAEASIHRKIADICLSMKKEDYLTLPERTYNEVVVPLPASARRVIADLRGSLVADLGLLGTFTAANSAVLSNRLRQVTAGFLYVDGDTSRAVDLHDARCRAAVEIVEGTGDNVLVAYAFRWERDHLLRAFKHAGIDARTIEERGVLKAWNRGEVKVLLAHPVSIGHGLNLQDGGHTALWASLTWALEEWQQFNDRLYRQGQGHPVVIHVLISPGTPDRDIFRALRDKKSVQDAFMQFIKEDHLLL